MKSPKLTRHVTDIHTIGVAIAIEINHGDSRRDRVIHTRMVETGGMGSNGAIAGIPQQGALQRIDHEDVIADDIRRDVSVTVFGGVISTANHQYELLGVLGRAADIHARYLGLRP